MQILIHTGIPIRIEIAVLRRQAPLNIADGFWEFHTFVEKNYLHFRFDIPSETQSNYMRGFSLTRLVIQFNFNVRRPNIDLMN